MYNKMLKIEQGLQNKARQFEDLLKEIDDKTKTLQN